ncbi:hypothetical protein B9Q10_00825 [Candidatus Marsarchaeota G2 archaeon ECH_B_SAG-E12]|uniref:Uncharacterized protein n=1 Tax=Candidatus Marsarchaeota G2 archaeon ECH_B_SAG-E12 TaxID=1978164 RepID=A0A2R6BWB7_9ARCH|nr:MAG: hypothetical protein B9Q10_00825 [Candidatus Marsarchaeota G2 archaeon ECH_B_SAG-E12]
MIQNKEKPKTTRLKLYASSFSELRSSSASKVRKSCSFSTHNISRIYGIIDKFYHKLKYSNLK